ncbi:MAG: alpha/beta fold hydrolase [Pseudobdellovibrionaceae bacterium]
MLYFFVFLNVILLPWSNAYCEEQAKCNDKGICTIKMPVVSDDGHSQELSYSFKYRPPEGDAPTVVFIPGGPGSKSTDQDPKKIANIPDNFGVILTDPRFVGINEIRNPDSFKNSMRTDLVADDILRAIKSVKAKNYILYGVSYGTMAATVAASKAGANPPRAVVLESTVGHSTTQSDIQLTYNEKWKLYVKAMAPGDFRKFKASIRSFIQSGQFKPEDFGQAIMTLLTYRRNALGVDDLDYWIQLMIEGPKDRAIRVTQSLLKVKNSEPGAKIFGSVVKCRELLPDAHLENSDLAFDGIGDSLKPSGHSDCAKFGNASNQKLFDSKNFQIQEPIIYIQGQNDPITPNSQAEYHYKNQARASSKIMVIVPDGSHSPLNKAFNGCSEAFWNKLKGDVRLTKNAFSNCIPNHTEINSSSAQKTRAVQ